LVDGGLLVVAGLASKDAILIVEYTRDHAITRSPIGRGRRRERGSLLRRLALRSKPVTI
jgi:hypothetical protein